MATEKQANYFSSIYIGESERTKSLREIAKVYIGLISLYSGFIIAVTEKTKPTSLAEVAIYIACVVAFLLAFHCALQVLQVSSYERPSDPYRIINGFGDTPPTDDEFLDDRIIDFAVATNRNALVNDKKARYLSASGYLILCGLAGHAAYFLLWMTTRTVL